MASPRRWRGTPAQARALVVAALAEANPDAVLFDGLEHALVGVATTFPHYDPVAVYDEAMILAGLVAEGLSWHEAWEHYSYNIQGLGGAGAMPMILVPLAALAERGG